MLPSLRKKSEAATPTAPKWHPNFRNYERLPDTKVVRTSFFINGVAVLAAVAVVLAFGYQEYSRYTLSQQIADWDQQIETHRAAHTTALENFRKFQAEEKRIQEVAAFVERKFTLSELLLRIGATLPADLAITYLDYRPTGITLRGSVRGNPGEASGVASAYVAQLQADEQVGRLFESVTMTNVARNPTTGALNIEILLKLPDAKKTAGKAPQKS